MMRPATNFLLSCVFALTLAATASPAAAQGNRTDPDAPTYIDPAQAAQRRREMLMEGEQQKLQNARKEAKARAKAAKKGKVLKPGQRARKKLPPDIDPAAMQEALRRAASELSARGGGMQTFAAPLNVRLNNPAGDAFGSGQSEVSIAMLGPYGVAAWNDGQGFVTPPGGQGVAYTTDGGASWVDAGTPPFDGGGQIVDWTSDPVIALNEKTGEFWYCGLIDAVGSNNGIATVKMTFPGGAFTWGTSYIVQTGPDASAFHDKQWIVADSLSGNLYLSWTHFVPGADYIYYRRSTDDGATWDPVIKLNAGADDGYVQASRPVVAGDGTVYVTWKVLGASTDDYVKIRRSTDGGVSFGAETIAASFIDNFGSGAAGFNRNRNVVEPGNAVDRSFGPNRGRVAVVVHESLNFYDDPIGTGTGNASKKEIETGSSGPASVSNNAATGAEAFTVGQIVRGRLATLTDRDWYSFTASAGQTYIFFADSVDANSGTGILYTFRVFCGADTLTSLAYSGDISGNSDPAATSLLVWTAPATATYYLRIVQATGTASLGNYRIQTGTALQGPEVGRDQREATIRYSDDGGATWSAPIRVNDDLGRYDNFLPEIGYSTEGYLYAAWYDFRNSAADCAGSADIRVSRSRDGGATWDPSQLVTTAQSPFSKIPTNIAPNHGDYIGLYAGDVLALGWGDGRTWNAGGDLDSWGAIVQTGFAASSPPDTSTQLDATFDRAYTLDNSNVLFDQPLNYSVSVDRAWPGYPIAGSTTVPAGGSIIVTPTMTVPDSAAAGDVAVCFTATLPNGALSQEVCHTLTINASLDVPSPGRLAFALHGARPNPARGRLGISFSLPSAAPARLELMDVNGRRVFDREVGSLGAGTHVIQLDRELASLPTGVYAVKLSQSGRVQSRKVSVIQ